MVRRNGDGGGNDPEGGCGMAIAKVIAVGAILFGLALTIIFTCAGGTTNPQPYKPTPTCTYQNGTQVCIVGQWDKLQEDTVWSR